MALWQAAALYSGYNRCKAAVPGAIEIALVAKRDDSGFEQVWQNRGFESEEQRFFLSVRLVFDGKICYHLFMNSRHLKTLEAVFSRPVLRNIEWRRIESMLIAFGCELIEGRGSRVAFKRGALRADFHRPHPGKEAKPYQVRAVREFLEKLGIRP